MASTYNGMSAGEALLLVQNLTRAAFNIPREPRSEAYQHGARELLKQRATGVTLVCPFASGTASADAFYAGADEGRFIWTKYLATQAQAMAAEVA